MREVMKRISPRPNGFGGKINGVIRAANDVAGFLQPGLRFVKGRLAELELIEAEIDPASFRAGKEELHRASMILYGLGGRDEDEYSMWGHTDDHAFTICNPYSRASKTGFIKESAYPEAHSAGLEVVMRMREDKLRHATQVAVKEAIEQHRGSKPLRGNGIRLAQTLAKDPAIGAEEVIAYQDTVRETAGEDGYVEGQWQREQNDNITAFLMARRLRHFRAVHTEADYLEGSSLCTISTLPGR